MFDNYSVKRVPQKIFDVKMLIQKYFVVQENFKLVLEIIAVFKFIYILTKINIPRSSWIFFSLDRG